jgi:hypothetical protein
MHSQSQRRAKGRYFSVNIHVFTTCRYRDSVTSIMTRLWNEGSAVRFCSSPKRPDRLRVPTNLLLDRYRSVLWKQRGWGVKLTNSPPSGAGSNEWRSTSAPPIWRHSLHRDNFCKYTEQSLVRPIIDCRGMEGDWAMHCFSLLTGNEI